MATDRFSMSDVMVKAEVARGLMATVSSLPAVWGREPQIPGSQSSALMQGGWGLRAELLLLGWELLRCVGSAEVSCLLSSPGGSMPLSSSPKAE